MTIGIATVFILLFPFMSAISRNCFAKLWCASVLRWLRFCCGVHYKLSGYENIPHYSSVFIANHQSSWETILFYKLATPVSPILKKELLHIPFWGWSMRLLDPIAIDRSKPHEAGKSLLTQGVEKLAKGKSVIVFPEGARSPPGTINRFSRGGAKLAIAAEAMLVPISHNAGDCWPPRQFIKHPGLISVSIGHPINPAGRSASDLTNQVEQWIRDNYQTSGF